MSGFLDKNNDLLYRNIKEVRGFTTACIISWPDINNDCEIDINAKIVCYCLRSCDSLRTELYSIASILLNLTARKDLRRYSERTEQSVLSLSFSL